MNKIRRETAAGTGKAKKRAPHSIRFLGPEWDRIEAFAGDRGLTPAGVRPLRGARRDRERGRC